MKDNPYFGHAPDPKRELTDAQQKLFIEMLVCERTHTVGLHAAGPCDSAITSIVV
jgi:hypothetical protein